MNNAVASGGRVALPVPFAENGDVELGRSGETGSWDRDGARQWSAGVLDCLVHLGPGVEVCGECIATRLETDG